MLRTTHAQGQVIIEFLQEFSFTYPYAFFNRIRIFSHQPLLQLNESSSEGLPRETRFVLLDGSRLARVQLLFFFGNGCFAARMTGPS